MCENKKDLIYMNDNNHNKLYADCENCFGLCCIALYFSASEGFPVDKNAGEPCPNLQTDFRCNIHENLIDRGMKGCNAFDCFGAGQKVARISFDGRNWRKYPELSKQMFEVFLIMRQLHELLWYLTESLTLQQASPIQNELSSKVGELERLSLLDSNSLIKVDVAALRGEVNTLLVRVSELVRNAIQVQGSQPRRKKTLDQRADLIAADLRKTDLRGANLRGACLIAADLRGTDLNGVDFIGADLRDADLRGTDLSKSIFLTQAQLNVAKGDKGTKLPPLLSPPKHWNNN
ncbi:pentapeptide repeat-containing protein [Alkalicella caledoniensis]|uniref:Pentapeptide repeat-containing protein n=1 Tax=Alkalicella caledoniensis TaxID=2731377 RepID=A0A7G9W6F4_ALKCA|nr:pentapeptide repeat-containing protein [Alkalicella caledoniensis]QNO14266.1 pentapeptide repeat-containing protein [Alkalicella caledoniensis]